MAADVVKMECPREVQYSVMVRLLQRTSTI